MRDLAPKQARFVEEYLVDLNATQAAIRAGYSQRTAVGSALRSVVPERPVYWLVESFLEDPAAKRARAVAQLADLLPQLTALMKAAGGEPALKAVV